MAIQHMQRCGNLKKAKQPVAQPVYVVGDDVNDKVVAGLSLGERMVLEDDLEDPAGNITDKKPGGDRIYLDSTKEFLYKAFVPVNNAESRQLRQQYIIPDTTFTTSPHLDKVMAVECSKSTKSAALQLSRIQALFLDVVGLLSGLIDNINKGTEVAVDDRKGAVKAALTFLGNASSQCAALRRVGILVEYNIKRMRKP